MQYTCVRQSIINSAAYIMILFFQHKMLTLFFIVTFWCLLFFFIFMFLFFLVWQGLIYEPPILCFVWGYFQTCMKATPEEGISTQENQLMGISSSSIVGIFSTNTPVMYHWYIGTGLGCQLKKCPQYRWRKSPSVDSLGLRYLPQGWLSCKSRNCPKQYIKKGGS